MIEISFESWWIPVAVLFLSFVVGLIALSQDKGDYSMVGGMVFFASIIFGLAFVASWFLRGCL